MHAVVAYLLLLPLLEPDPEPEDEGDADPAGLAGDGPPELLPEPVDEPVDEPLVLPEERAPLVVLPALLTCSSLRTDFTPSTERASEAALSASARFLAVPLSVTMPLLVSTLTFIALTSLSLISSVFTLAVMAASPSMLPLLPELELLDEPLPVESMDELLEPLPLLELFSVAVVLLLAEPLVAFSDFGGVVLSCSVVAAVAASGTASAALTRQAR